MKPVDQTLLKERGEPGDCYRACVATILELPIDAVPHFVLEAYRKAGAPVDKRPFPYDALKAYDEESFSYEEELVNEFLASFGKRRAFVESWDQTPTEGYAIGSGPSPRGVHHAVVLDLSTVKRHEDGRIEVFAAHDPHPSRAGILELQAIEIFEDVAA